MKSRFVPLAVLVVGLLGLPGVVTPGAGADPVDDVLTPTLTYPDLVPDVREVYVDRTAVGFDPDTGTFVFGPPDLYFDTWAQNLGTVPVDLMADDPADPTASTVSQCVAWSPDFVCRERRRVGGFVWHDEHTHFHFQDFAGYELRKVRRNGKIDYSSRGLLGKSDKVSFCLIDTTPVREDAFPTATYASCNLLRQGISPGWADIYGAGLPGQHLPIEGLDDGRYALVVSMDFAGHLWESDEGNNVVEIIVELSNGGTQAAIVDRRRPSGTG